MFHCHSSFRGATGIIPFDFTKTDLKDVISEHIIYIHIGCCQPDEHPETNKLPDAKSQPDYNVANW